jgi:hypothetical protein
MMNRENTGETMMNGCFDMFWMLDKSSTNSGIVHGHLDRFPDGKRQKPPHRVGTAENPTNRDTLRFDVVYGMEKVV